MQSSVFPSEGRRVACVNAARHGRQFAVPAIRDRPCSFSDRDRVGLSARQSTSGLHPNTPTDLDTDMYRSAHAGAVCLLDLESHNTNIYITFPQGMDIEDYCKS